MNQRHVLSLLVVVSVAGCAQTNVTVLTQVPPGRTAVLDVDNKTLTVTKGLAVALECTAYDADFGQRPCGHLVVTAGNADLAQVLPVHLDALAGNTVNATHGDLTSSTSLSAPSARTGVVLAAIGEGTTTLDVTSDGPPVSLSLVVAPAPGADPALPSGG